MGFRTYIYIVVIIFCNKKNFCPFLYDLTRSRLAAIFSLKPVPKIYVGMGVILHRTFSEATVKVSVTIIFSELFYFEFFRLTIPDTKEKT